MSGQQNSGTRYHERPLFLLPGPTRVPERVLRAMARPIVNHRGKVFKEVFARVTDGLKWVFRTESYVAVYSSSGTGAMEAALVNLFSPGEPVLCFVMGAFGKRFVDIAKARGLQTRIVDVPWGTLPDSAAIRRELAADLEHPDGPARGILVTHNETSTGVTLDLEGFARIVREVDHPGLIVVDAVSSLGGIRLEMDAWGLDAVVTCSQKALMCPPGLGMLALSPRAREVAKRTRCAGRFWSYVAYAERAENSETPYTPAVSLWFGLDEALSMIREEGLEAVWARHARAAATAREGLEKLGYEIFGDRRSLSNTVTAFRVKPGFDGKKFRRYLDEEFGLTLGGGQGELEGKILRIGHMGYVTEEDIREGLVRLQQAEERWSGGSF